MVIFRGRQGTCLSGGCGRYQYLNILDRICYHQVHGWYTLLITGLSIENQINLGLRSIGQADVTVLVFENGSQMTDTKLVLWINVLKAFINSAST